MSSTATTLEKPKPKIFGTLLTEVIRKKICCGCGACVAVCPVNIISMKSVPEEDEQPTMVGRCILCEFCYYQCPWVPPYPSEEKIFGRKREEDGELGAYISVYTARTTNEEIAKVATDGGVVTTILAYMFQQGIIDAAVVSGIDEKKPWKTVPKVVSTIDELLKTAGTRYTVSPTILGLGSAVDEYGKERIALVGTPCQIKALRKMQTTEKGALKYGSKVILAIGLFCMESFYYDKLIGKYLKDKVDLSKISKFSIKGGKFMVITVDGKEAINVPLKEIRPYSRESCNNCTDFTAELADISVGSIGSADGWSTVVVRSEIGRKIFEECTAAGLIRSEALEKVAPGFESIIKISKKKKKS
ncbi:MAG: Coenzyme F420 hydrogenase/dehydrogenase, beta subunit C-terminal domain [Candidatus Bathyarchaeota archaeon]